MSAPRARQGFVISDYIRVERLPGFSCIMCGECCRDRVIPLYEEDLKRLSDLKDFYEPTTELERYFTGALYKMKLREDGSCFFLDPDNKCRIYDRRPNTCRRYPFIVSDEFLLVSISCPGLVWDEESDPEQYKAPSKEISKAIGKVLGILEGEDPHD